MSRLVGVNHPFTFQWHTIITTCWCTRYQTRAQIFHMTWYAITDDGPWTTDSGYMVILKFWCVATLQIPIGISNSLWSRLIFKFSQRCNAKLDSIDVYYVCWCNIIHIHCIHYWIWLFCCVSFQSSAASLKHFIPWRHIYTLQP